MRLASGQLALGACVVLAWASACGGTTDRKRPSSQADAGQTGSSSTPPSASGGGASSVDDEPSVAGSALDSGGHAAVSQGGAGSGAVVEGGVGQVAGGPAAALGGMTFAGESGAAGMPALGGEAGAAGTGGEAGAPATCCQPLDCHDILGGLECGINRFSDGCGGTFRCDCAGELLCQNGSCAACDPGPDPCAQNATLCGATSDACGNPIVCPDNCAGIDAQASCYQGQCCKPLKTACSADDCGHMLIGCGKSIDCTDASCAIETSCQPSGKCCKPSRSCLPGSCGFLDDGCGNYLDCGDTCDVGTVCLDNACHHSECYEQDLECGHTVNVEVSGLEWCGSCPQGEACMDNYCLPLCSGSL